MPGIWPGERPHTSAADDLEVKLSVAADRHDPITPITGDRRKRTACHIAFLAGPTGSGVGIAIGITGGVGAVGSPPHHNRLRKW